MYYWEVKTRGGSYVWFKHDTLLDVNMIEKSLLMDEILLPNTLDDEILYIKLKSTKNIGNFNLKYFTYTINEELLASE